LEWKNITDCSPTYRCYWPHWKSHAAKNHILEHHRESTDQGQTLSAVSYRRFLQRLGVIKAPTTPIHLESDCIVDHYIRRVEEHLRKVFASHLRNEDAR
jgi:hypothetical protein